MPPYCLSLWLPSPKDPKFTFLAVGSSQPTVGTLLSQSSVAFTQDPKFTSSAAGSSQPAVVPYCLSLRFLSPMDPNFTSSVAGSSQPAVATLLSQSSAALTHGPQIHLLGCWQLQASSCYPTVSVFGCSHPVTTQLQSRPPIWNFHSV